MTEQLTAADLDGMKPHEINAARRDGRLDSLLGKNATEIPVFPSRGDLQRMTPEQINVARAEGRINHLLRGEPAPETNEENN